MWKTTAQTALIALSLVTFGTGCDLADFINNIGGGGITYPVPVPPPVTPPTPIDDCEAQLDQCLVDVWGEDHGDLTMPVYDPDTGAAEEACYDAYAVCIDITPPPVDDCDLQLDACLQDVWGDNDGDLTMPYDPDIDDADQHCYDAYAICIDDTPPPPPVCDIELDDCLRAIYDVDYDITLPADGQARPPEDEMPYWDPEAEQACYDAYDDCTGVQPPPPPIDDCDLELDLCLQDIWADPTMPVPEPGFMPDAEQFCFDQYAICIDEPVLPPPPPIDACDQLFHDCIDNGVSFGLCEAVLDECQNPPEPCIDENGDGMCGDDTEPPMPEPLRVP